MRQYYTISLLIAASVTLGQTINIPDANFKNALVNTQCAVIDGNWQVDDDVDTNNDGEIDVSEAAAVWSLDVSNQNIASLEGIEYFTGLYHLYCSYNQLTSLTVTNSPWLCKLDCDHNQLTALTADLTNDWDYEPTLNFSYNNLTSITILPGFYYSIGANYNQFTEFVVPDDVSINNLNLSGNPLVTYDSSASNYFGWLVLSDCPLLTSARVRSGYAGISNNPLLTMLDIGSSGNYTVTNNPTLQWIDMKDGIYGYIEPDWPGVHYNITDNPALEFICLDDLGDWYYEGEWFYQDEMDNLGTVPQSVNRTFYCDFTPGGAYNTINGTVHFDCGGDNVALHNDDIAITLDSNSNGTADATSNPNHDGAFVFYVTGNGTLTPQLPNAYFTIAPASVAYSFPGTGNTQSIDFCLTPNGIHPDLEVTIIPVIPARPGFDAVYKIVYANKGTQVQSGTVNLAFEEDLTDLVTSNPAVTSQSSNMLSWDFNGLAPFEDREITLTLNVNSPMETPAVNNGDQLDFTASLSTAESDETPSDNVNALIQTVVGSYDPNDKAVSKNVIAPTALDEYLYYTVRFQNSGTYYAENVVIRDLLSNNLDLNTLDVVSVSHPCRSVLTREAYNTAGDKLEFFFEGINLPASQDDEPGSHGYVTYRIKPKNTLVVNNPIDNTAEIYFDFNSAIVTNTVTTTVTALGVSENNTIGFSLSPNPVNQTLVISLDSIATVETISIFNTIGQLIKTIAPAFENGQLTTDVSTLAQGSYLVKIESDNGTVTQKLVKL